MRRDNRTVLTTDVAVMLSFFFFLWSLKRTRTSCKVKEKKHNENNLESLKELKRVLGRYSMRFAYEAKVFVIRGNYRIYRTQRSSSAAGMTFFPKRSERNRVTGFENKTRFFRYRSRKTKLFRQLGRQL